MIIFLLAWPLAGLAFFAYRAFITRSRPIIIDETEIEGDLAGYVRQLNSGEAL